MHSIEIYGYAAQELCAGCEHGHETAGCGTASCAPGAKRPTNDLVREFAALISAAGIPLRVDFYEATEENIARHPDVARLLSMADLAPVIVMNGKVLFLGGFSPEGLLQEVRKRL